MESPSTPKRFLKQESKVIVSQAKRKGNTNGDYSSVEDPFPTLLDAFVRLIGGDPRSDGNIYVPNRGNSSQFVDTDRSGGADRSTAVLQQQQLHVDCAVSGRIRFHGHQLDHEHRTKLRLPQLWVLPPC